MRAQFILLLFIIATVFAKKDCSKPPCDTIYDLIIVGGGSAGVTSSYLIDLVNRLATETKTNLNKTIDLSNVLLIEANNYIGGDAKSGETVKTTPGSKELLKQLYGYNGPILYDQGPTRIPQLTTRLMRSLAFDTQTIVEEIPYTTREYSRGRVVRCGNANFDDYSPENPYGMPSTCTGSVPEYVGDSSVPWQYTDGIGPAFNLSVLQPWAYLDGSGGLNSIYNYLLFDSPNPVTCPNPDATCEECGDCFSNTSIGYLNLQGAIIGQLTHEPTELLILDYAGFYGDWRKGLYNASLWRDPYFLREFDTNRVNGYVVGGFNSYILNLVKPLSKKGKILLNTFVTEMWSTGGGTGVKVKTNTGKEFFGKFLIYAGQPENIATGRITGNLAEDIVNDKQFKSVYSIHVIRLNVELNNTFWDFDLPPNIDTNSTFIKEWTVLRGIGDMGCVPRFEIRHSPYGDASILFLASYNDYVCIDTYELAFNAFISNDKKIYDQLWIVIRNDLANAFQIPVDNIPKKFINLNISLFTTGWYYPYSNNTLSYQDVVDYAVAPLGLDVPFCLAQEAWDTKYLGWAEASMRTALRCIDRIIPGTIDLVECWMFNIFPPCDPPDSCYSNGDTILGTETIIPSKYCNERWWINDFVQTSNCTSTVTLNKNSCGLKVSKLISRNYN